MKSMLAAAPLACGICLAANFAVAQPVMALFEAGRIARVPRLIGTNTDEGSVFAFNANQDCRWLADNRSRAVAATVPGGGRPA